MGDYDMFEVGRSVISIKKNVRKQKCANLIRKGFDNAGRWEVVQSSTLGNLPHYICPNSVFNSHISWRHLQNLRIKECLTFV